MAHIEFYRIDYIAFKKRYNQAVKDKEEQFTFKGAEFLTSYAKYVCEYLAMQFEKKK